MNLLLTQYITKSKKELCNPLRKRKNPWSIFCKVSSNTFKNKTNRYLSPAKSYLSVS